MKLKLNDKTGMDLGTLIESRLLIQANSGGGKSWAIRRIVEQAMAPKDHVQVIILDPEGEFSNLRSKYDFVYVGNGGDAPAEPRSAALLARRLLELKASAIIDLYELPPHERKHFVKLFCEAMVNAPKELWHDCLVVIDEAHVFAPEKSDSEALGPVIDLATRGRKRGYCVVLASQRISKLHKDAAAECNNKLIGRTSLDIDRKRAGEELGLTSREDILALRNLVPGEFMAFGPAFGRDVERLHIGDVSVKPPKRGVRGSRPPAPSVAVKKILGQLKDLPQEAKKELTTIAELKHRIAELERAPKTIVANVSDVSSSKELQKKWYDLGFAAAKELQHKRDLAWEKVVVGWKKYAQGIIAVIVSSGETLKNRTEPPVNPPFSMTPSNLVKATLRIEQQRPQKPMFETATVKPTRDDATFSDVSLGKGEREVLNAIAQDPDGITTEHLAVLTGYKQTSRRVYVQRLTAIGYLEKDGEILKATETGITALGSSFRPLPTGDALREYLQNTLPEGEKRVFQAIVDGNEVTREQIQEATGYKATSVRVYVQRLTARKAIVQRGSVIMLSDKLVG